MVLAGCVLPLFVGVREDYLETDLAIGYVGGLFVVVVAVEGSGGGERGTRGESGGGQEGFDELEEGFLFELVHEGNGGKVLLNGGRGIDLPLMIFI